MNDTIVAISTALGVGAISVIRISGPKAITISNQIYKGFNLKKASTHTIHYGHIMEQDEIIDEVLISVMHAPKTFTMEDVIEIQCHGGIATTNKILTLLLEHGCRLAEPGEFTKRAFLNGRIDLLEAEGIMDLIAAKTDQSRKLAVRQVSGTSSHQIHLLRQELLEILANIEVNIDYPEYDDNPKITTKQVINRLSEFQKKLENILKISENMLFVKEGIKTVIVGRPNVGKSSLLNVLLEEEKAIVTDIAGTTRDIVEGTIQLDGLLLHLIDTAGIRATKDEVEQIGVQKTLQSLDQADLVLFLLNQNEQLTIEDIEIYEQIQSKPHIIIINKMDLESKLEKHPFSSESIVYVSAITRQGIEDLQIKIKELFEIDQIILQDQTYLTNARSISLLKETLALFDHLYQELEYQPIDIVAIDIKQIWTILGSITGEVYEEDLLNQLFSKFCLGK